MRGNSGLVFFMSIVIAALLVATACGQGSSTSGGTLVEDEVQISLSEYKFDPANLEVRAGSTITIRLVNDSQENKEHELMIGREVKMGGDFGDQPDGFERDFFEGVEVELVDAKDVMMLMAGEATLTGEKAQELLGMEMDMGMDADMDMGESGRESGMEGGMESGDDHAGEGADDHAGFMIELEPGGTATLRFTVPEDKVGEWTIGCFSQDGQHFGEGMKGTLTVVQ